MKKHPVMTSQFPGKCTIVIRTPFIWSKFQSTRSRIAFLADKVTCNNRTQFGAGRVHLQSNLSEGRSHTVRRTLNPTTRTEWWHWKATGIQQQQQRLSGDVSSSGKLVAVETWKKRCPRPHDGMIRPAQGKLCGILCHLSTKGHSSKSIFDLKEYLNVPSYKTKNRWKKSTKSWKSWELDHPENPFVTIWRKKVTRSSVKNQVAPSTIWATWSWSNWDRPRRLFSVFLSWSTYQTDWTCVYVASGFDPVKIRWTESEEHLQPWELRTSYSSKSVTREKSTDITNWT